MIQEFEVHTDIPQGSPLSLILYLFDNADLLDICERPGTRTSGLALVDDINILAFSTSTEENCKNLNNCTMSERYASKHEVVFALARSELIHLTCTTYKKIQCGSHI